MEFLFDFYGDVQIKGYSEEITKNLLPTAIIFGVLISALLIFAAFASKKGRVITFFAAIPTLAVTVLGPKYAELFHTVEAVKYVYGYSDAEINAKLEEYYASLIPYYLFIILFSLCTILSLIFTIILCVKVMKATPKVFGIFALIITIMRYIFISPVPIISSLINGGATISGQQTQLLIYYASFLVPALLLATGALIRLISPKKNTAA